MLWKEEELEKSINVLQTLIESEVTGEQEKADASREQGVKKKEIWRELLSTEQKVRSWQLNTTGGITRTKKYKIF